MPYRWLLFVCFILFFTGFVYLLWYFYFRKNRAAKTIPSFSLTRAGCNPLLSPEDGEHWETEGVFNPAVFQDENGTHIFYRAIGGDGVSRIGYAKSSDGSHITERLPYPLFAMRKPRRDVLETEKQQYSLVLYPSGGSWGGTEDPRAVCIDGRIYLTFNAFDTWDSIRIAVTSISVSDFAARKWNWSRPLFISPENQQNKNWVFFPEKINGKFAIIHSITPTILIDYVDRLEDLDYGTQTIQSRSHPQQGGRHDFWDNRVRSAGAPPIKTNKGWLVLYHAISHHEPHKYKLGALLLDLEDPTKIIARSPTPLLTPDEWYENDAKPGIVYICGALVKNDILHVYYGGGDKYVCSAHASLSSLLDWLVRFGAV